MTNRKTIPNLFDKNWQKGNFKDSNKFSQHDNYNLLQNYGEYFDTGYGKKYIEDKWHRSTFTLTYITNPELSKVPQKSRLNEFIFYTRRFPKKDESVPKPPISLAMNTLGSEKLCILPTKPIRPSHKEVKVDPWKYSYSKNTYSADYIERIKILRSTCFDLSKY